MKAVILLAASALTLAGSLMGAGQDTLKRIDINVFQESAVQGDQYTIGEIASINGYNVELTKEISEIVVGPSPQPGGSFRINQGLVNSRLRKYSYYDINIQVPADSLVSRASLRVEGSEIASLVKNKLGENSELAGLNYELVGKASDIFLPTGQLDYKVSTRQTISPPPPVISYQVEFFINGVRKHMVSMMFKQSDAGRPMAHNSANNEADRESNQPQTIRAREDVKLLTSKTEENKNESTHNLKAGSLVKLVYRSGSISLETEGIATKAGSVGDILEFVNTATKKKITARIVSASEAEVL